MQTINCKGFSLREELKYFKGFDKIQYQDKKSLFGWKQIMKMAPTMSQELIEINKEESSNEKKKSV